IVGGRLSNIISTNKTATGGGHGGTSANDATTGNLWTPE
ncbi:hypothetical protein F441_22097, partial [Phytophthora nicotianae CJ01A1]